MFSGRFGPHPGEVLFERICRERGISHRLTGLRSPTTTGMIERFFRSLKEECVWQHNFANFPEAKAAINNWIRWYNDRRPHQALGYLSPHQFRAQQLQAVA